MTGGGDPNGASATDTIPVSPDACPNGWARGSLNPERADGCSLLDLVWEAGPFASQAAFNARVNTVAAGFPGADPAAVIAATPNPVGGIDNSCADVIAFTFDDGPSYYRPQTLAAFRAQGVPATFFNLAVRMQANPQIDRFSLAEGHKVLLHSYEHPRLTNLSANGLRFQVEGAAALFAANGAPLSHKVLRAPFGGTNAAVNEAVAAMGYAMDGSGSAGTLDFDPGAHDRTDPGRHDRGAAPRPRPAAARRADRHPRWPGCRGGGPQIIDEAQARGFCFGTLDEAGRVVAGRYVDTGLPIRRSSTRSPTSRPRTPGRRRHRTSSSRSRCGSRRRMLPAVFLRGGTRDASR